MVEASAWKASMTTTLPSPHARVAFALCHPGPAGSRLPERKLCKLHCTTRSLRYIRRGQKIASVASGQEEFESVRVDPVDVAALNETASKEATVDEAPAWPEDVTPDEMPRHVAIIMDGNLRWAAARSLPAVLGHERGASSLREVVRCCRAWGIPALTVFAFSTENWRRPKEEVTFLLQLMENTINSELESLLRNGVRFCCIGDRDALPASLRAAIDNAETATRRSSELVLTVAIGYGGRREIALAAREIAVQVARGDMAVEDINESALAAHMSTTGMRLPDPDLLIRTSGERRLSNFLLWQLAYAELHFSPVLWPDFSAAHFALAIRDFASRERRFGSRSPA